LPKEFRLFFAQPGIHLAPPEPENVLRRA
jgi:hypothetical protein